MRRLRLVLASLVCLWMLVSFAGCGSTSNSGGGGSTSGLTLAANPTLSIAQGQTQTFSVTPTGGSGAVAISVSGLPAGVTLTPTSASVNAGTAASFTLTASATAALGTSSVAVQGSSGSLSAQATISLTVTAAVTPPGQDFTLSASPNLLVLGPRSAGQVVLTSQGVGGFAGPIAIAVNGLPTGVTVAPSSISVTPGTQQTVTVTVAANAPIPAGPVQISFVGTSGSLSHTANIDLSIVAMADFSISATPTTATVAQGGQSNDVHITIGGSNGFGGAVTFTVTGLPTGVGAVPPSSTLQSGDAESIAFRAAADAPLGPSTVTVTGVSGTLTHAVNVTLTVTNPPPPDVISLSLSPASQTVTIGSYANVAVTAAAPSTYQGTVHVTPQNLPAGVSTYPAAADVTPGVAQNFALIAGSNAQAASSTMFFLGQVNSVNGTANLNLTVVSPQFAGMDAPTWHYDMERSGLYAAETNLTPSSVTSANFGKQSTIATDAAVDAQPLYLSSVTIGSAMHNVLYVATENDTVYALDADTNAVLWKSSALGTNETASDNRGCSEVSPLVGITATPVIDRYASPNGALYLVAKTKDSSGGYHQRLHALDLTTGAELSGSPVEIAATYPASGGKTNVFYPDIFVERAALLLNNGNVYLSWAAPCQQGQPPFDYDGWVMAYSEATLAQESVLDVTPNGSGGGIWMSGAGPAADGNGNVFLITSTGTFDTTLDANGRPASADYGNGYLKIQAASGVMNIFDYFEPLNGVPGAANYQDQGSGGVMVMEGAQAGNGGPSRAIGAGKDGNIYELGSAGNQLGEYNGATDNNFFTLTAALPNGATSSPSAFNGTFYYGGGGDAVKAFALTPTGATLSGQSANTLGAAGGTPVISANGASTPVLWVLDTTASGGPVLYAYDATNLSSELYNSTQAQVNGAARDTIDSTGRFAVPVVIHSRVYIGTQSGVDVFGLLH